MDARRLRTAGIVAAVAALIAAAGTTVVWSYPTAAECVASGRTVDPTFRHCESAGGYTQIREHVVLHVRGGAAVAAVLVLLFGGPVYLLIRRRRAGAGPPQ